MYLKNLFVLMLLILPFDMLAQVPKAYETEHYSTTLQGHQIKFVLANGYISYSKLQLYIHKKPVAFEATSGAPDEHNQMKFITRSRKDYFIIYNMQDAYDDIPQYFKGKYFTGGKIIPVKLIKLNSVH